MGAFRLFYIDFLRWRLVGMMLCLLILPAGGLAAASQLPEDRQMTFALMHAGDCKQTCTQWLSAEGVITPDTPKRFKASLKLLKGKKLPVVLQSHGGDVDAALAVARLIRAAGLDTALGRTVIGGCPMLDPRCPDKIVKKGWTEGEVMSAGSFCYSACTLILAGGKVRAGAGDFSIGLHQITNGRKSESYGTYSRRNLDAISTKADASLKKELTAFFAEMGVVPEEVFFMMGLATPEGMNLITNVAALKSGLITKVSNYSDQPGYVFHPQE
jgi:hypothetical protein